MLLEMDSTGMIAARRRPFCVNLDTLYIRWIGSGIAGSGVNHSTYARCVVGLM
jgi:hypothetical protein